MSKRRASREQEAATWGSARQTLEALLKGPTRQEILDHAFRSGDPDMAIETLRAGMRSHVLRTAQGPVQLQPVVRTLDSRTRRDGFHVLLEWDHAGHRFLEEEVPVLMLDYFKQRQNRKRPLRETLAILLDYYFLYVLAVLVLRAWDEGDPNQNLDRITGLLGELQGPRGSGHRFLDDWETLIFIAISHYEPDDLAYHRLLRQMWDLDEAHRVSLARVTAPVFGSHLRWGFPSLYNRDLVRMRDDNFSDYPWLFFSVMELMRGYARMRRQGTLEAERRELVGALLSGLTPDPWMFVEKPLPSIAEYAADHAEFQELFVRYKDDLLEEFEAHRPTKGLYTPLGFHFNFLHNALIAMLVNGLLGAPTPNLGMSALWVSEQPGGAPEDSPEVMARLAMNYAAQNPERRSGRLVLMIAYDWSVALRSYSRTVGVLREGSQGA